MTYTYDMKEEIAIIDLFRYNILQLVAAFDQEGKYLVFWTYFCIQ